MRSQELEQLFYKMAAGNGEIFVTDNLVASDGAGKRDVMVASSSAVASKMMKEGNAEVNAEEVVQMAVKDGGDAISKDVVAGAEHRTGKLYRCYCLCLGNWPAC